MDEGRNEGLIKFEVGGEAVEVEDEGFEVEWRIEAEGKIWRITMRKGRVPATVLESNRMSTLQHPRRDFRFQPPLLRTMQLFEGVLCEGSARRDAGEVGHLNSDGGIRI